VKSHDNIAAIPAANASQAPTRCAGGIVFKKEDLFPRQIRKAGIRSILVLHRGLHFPSREE
jgi:hypothetical protein